MASKTLGRFLLKALGVLAFCAVSGYALFLAYGYNVDLQHRGIEKTSIIDVINQYPDSRIYLDDKIIGNSLPLQIKDLVPGFYNLSIQKLGYSAWSRKLEVQPDFVTKVDDAVLVPEHPDNLLQQLVHFPENSRYFYSKDFFIVLTPDSDYLTLVYLLNEGAIKEEELKLSHSAIHDIHIYTPQRFLISFDDGTYEWVEFNGPRFVDFSLPEGASQLSFLPSSNQSFFVYNNDLYTVPIDLLPTVTTKNIENFLLVKKIDQFDLHDGRIVYLSKGMAYSSDTNGKNIRLIDGSHTLSYVRYVPFVGFSGGLYVVRTTDNKRLLYAMDEKGTVTLLSPQLKDDVYLDNAGRIIFDDASGNIFLYKPLTKKKTLVTTLPEDFSLEGFLFNDGHFLFVRQQQLFLADITFTNVYPLFAHEENTHYFFQNGAVFSLVDQKLKSLFFLPKV